MRLTLILAGALALATSLSAQRGGGRAANGPGTQNVQAALDLTQQSVLEGPVAAVHLTLGAQYPSIAIKGKQVKLAPVWFLLENDFEIKAGDLLRVTAAPSTRPGDAYLYALSVVNTKTQAAITLRDAQGIPEWAGGRAGRGNRQGGQRCGSGAACIDPATVKTYTGIIDTITLGAGIEMPTLVVKVGTELVSFRIGPERILLENDFELAAGEAVTVVAAWCPCGETNIALSIANAAGHTIVLRGEDGTPAW